MLEIAQGGLANRSGNTLEATIIGTLGSKGFTTVNYNAYIKNPAQYGTELLLRHVPFVSIFGHKAKSEFVLDSQRHGLKIRIECKEYWVTKDREKIKYLPSNICKALQKLGFKKFTIHQHTILWQKEKAKDPSKGYGVLVEKNWYWYANWLSFVKAYCEKNQHLYT